jgi:SsrA-binding protein
MAKKPTLTERPKPTPKKEKPKEVPPVAVNRKARFEYEIKETMEAGLVLFGTEVKSLRQGRANIAESYASHKNGEIWLWNADIPVYTHGNLNNHEPRRGRKLLLNARQIKKLIGLLKVRGTTLVPLKVYFNKRGYAKLELAVGIGKKEFEKRETIKERDWKRQQGRLLRS